MTQSPEPPNEEASDEPEQPSNIYIAWKVAGCLFGAIGIWVSILGLPIAVYHGITTGDWTWLAAVGAFTAVLIVGFKSGWIESLND